MELEGYLYPQIRKAIWQLVLKDDSLKVLSEDEFSKQLKNFNEFTKTEMFREAVDQTILNSKNCRDVDDWILGIAGEVVETIERYGSVNDLLNSL